MSFQHGFTKRKPYLVNLTAYNEVTGLVNDRRAVDAIYLDFRKVFNTVSHNFLIDKLTNYGLDKWIMRWIKNWLNCQAQGVLIGNAKSTSTMFTSGVSQGSILGPILYDIFSNNLESMNPQQVFRWYKLE